MFDFQLRATPSTSRLRVAGVAADDREPERVAQERRVQAGDPVDPVVGCELPTLGDRVGDPVRVEVGRAAPDELGEVLSGEALRIARLLPLEEGRVDRRVALRGGEVLRDSVRQLAAGGLLEQLGEKAGLAERCRRDDDPGGVTELRRRRDECVPDRAAVCGPSLSVRKCAASSSRSVEIGQPRALLDEQANADSAVPFRKKSSSSVAFSRPSSARRGERSTIARACWTKRRA